jgi:D-alanyl-D-alanine carboxypeptidase
MNSGGEVIYEKNADVRSRIASTTKLLTALVVLENSDPAEELTVRPEWTGIEGSSMYLRAGERYTVHELLEGLLLASGNDAATALACHTAGGTEDFAVLMNRKARELGMDDSHFSNPHGLDAEDHYATARDLAVLMAACLQNRTLAGLLAETSATVGEQTYVNHNKLLTLCPGCLGGKTGFTEAAGRCLVSCCEREGTRLICVTLRDPDDWVDHQVLYNWAFSRYATRNVTQAVSFEVPVVSGERRLVGVEARPLRLFLPRTAEITLAAHLPRFVFAPVKAGEHAGVVQVFRDGERIHEAELIYSEGAAAAAWHGAWNDCKNESQRRG